MTDSFATFALIGGAVLVGLILLAAGVKFWELYRARSWLPVPGVVAESRVESRRVDGTGNQPARTGNFAKVVYRYEVQGRRYSADRVSIGAQMPDVDVEQTLARYPVGENVTVYYNPARPGQAVLERDLPPDVGKGLVGLLVFFGGGALLLFLYFTRGAQWLAGRMPSGGQAGVAVVLLAMGVFAVLVALAMQRRAAQASGWTQTPAKIVSVGVESFSKSATGRRIGPVTMYAPKVVYRYETGRRAYEGDRLHLGAAVSYSSQAMAQRRLTAYAVGQTVTVHVNPENAAESVLDPRARHLWVLWLAAAALLVGAAVVAGWAGTV